jgi:hypothetical protein
MHKGKNGQVGTAFYGDQIKNGVPAVPGEEPATSAIRPMNQDSIINEYQPRH